MTEQSTKLYSDAKWEHHERGDEDGPDYGVAPPSAPIASQILPATSITQIIQRWLPLFRRYGRRTGRITPRLVTLRTAIDDACRSGEITPAQSVELWNAVQAQVAAAAARHAQPKIAKRRDGIRLGDEATQELLDAIFGPDKPNL